MGAWLEPRSHNWNENKKLASSFPHLAAGTHSPPQVLGTAGCPAPLPLPAWTRPTEPMHWSKQNTGGLLSRKHAFMVIMREQTMSEGDKVFSHDLNNVGKQLEGISNRKGK